MLLEHMRDNRRAGTSDGLVYFSHRMLITFGLCQAALRYALDWRKPSSYGRVVLALERGTSPTGIKGTLEHIATLLVRPLIVSISPFKTVFHAVIYLVIQTGRHRPLVLELIYPGHLSARAPRQCLV